MVSTARTSRSVHPVCVTTGAGSEVSRVRGAVPVVAGLCTVTDFTTPLPGVAQRGRRPIGPPFPANGASLGTTLPSLSPLVTGVARSPPSGPRVARARLTAPEGRPAETDRHQPADREAPPTPKPPKDTVTALEPRADAAAAPSPGLAVTVRNYVALTKPRIIELLLVTTVPTMFLAQRGLPSLWLVVATLVGGALSAGSANTLNCYIDRDIDKLMHRTEGRPLATGAITPAAALRFGIALSVVSTLWLGLLVNWLSAALSFGAMAFYVGVYTMVLKRRTAQNIVWGGAAGCMPVLIGWSAVTDTVAWP